MGSKIYKNFETCIALKSLIKSAVLFFSTKAFPLHLEMPQALNTVQTFEMLVQMGKNFRWFFYTG